MSGLPPDRSPGLSPEPTRFEADVAALVHFSGYIRREARRLGLTEAAEKAASIERQFLSELEKL